MKREGGVIRKMGLSFMVSNQPLKTNSQFPEGVLKLFQKVVGRDVVPFGHQGKNRAASL